MESFCKNCGAAISSDDKFCESCGAKNPDYNGGNEVIGRGLNLIWDFEPINEESVNDFDLQSFRAEAAKDILCAMIQGGYGEDRIIHQSELAVKYADELITQLKEKEA